MNKIVLIAAGVLMSAVVSQSATIAQAAGKTDCEVSYTRTSCPGQEATSYKKCGGKQSCVKFKKADSAEACQKAAMKSCGNRRPNITKSKVITAKYMGQAVKSPSGKADFCMDYPKRDAEFNHCSK